MIVVSGALLATQRFVLLKQVGLFYGIYLLCSTKRNNRREVIEVLDYADRLIKDGD